MAHKDTQTIPYMLLEGSSELLRKLSDVEFHIRMIIDMANHTSEVTDLMGTFLFKIEDSQSQDLRSRNQDPAIKIPKSRFKNGDPVRNGS